MNIIQTSILQFLDKWDEVAVYIDLTSFQMLLVISMMLTGMYAKWSFQHHQHQHDHDE